MKKIFGILSVVVGLLFCSTTLSYAGNNTVTSETEALSLANSAVTLHFPDGSIVTVPMNAVAASPEFSPLFPNGQSNSFAHIIGKSVLDEDEFLEFIPTVHDDLGGKSGLTKITYDGYETGEIYALFPKNARTNVRERNRIKFQKSGNVRGFIASVILINAKQGKANRVSPATYRYDLKKCIENYHKYDNLNITLISAKDLFGTSFGVKSESDEFILSKIMNGLIPGFNGDAGAAIGITGGAGTSDGSSAQTAIGSDIWFTIIEDNRYKEVSPETVLKRVIEDEVKKQASRQAQMEIEKQKELAKMLQATSSQN